MKRAIVIGANSVIARCIIERLLEEGAVDRVTAVSRTNNPQLRLKHGNNLEWVECDYSEEAIENVCDNLTAEEDDISHAFICNGVLHSGQIGPEKRLEDVTASKLQSILQTNAVIPMLWLAGLAPALRGTLDCTLAVFSARVGSIADNRSGGWYSYRASKAALNMLVQTASIEYRRRASNVKLIAFHPGTTDTPLSQPFQRSVPEGKLFTADFVANSLLRIMADVDRDSGAEFLDWAGETVPW